MMGHLFAETEDMCKQPNLGKGPKVHPDYHWFGALVSGPSDNPVFGCPLALISYSNMITVRKCIIRWLKTNPRDWPRAVISDNSNCYRKTTHGSCSEANIIDLELEFVAWSKNSLAPRQIQGDNFGNISYDSELAIVQLTNKSYKDLQNKYNWTQVQPACADILDQEKGSRHEKVQERPVELMKWNLQTGHIEREWGLLQGRWG